MMHLLHWFYTNVWGNLIASAITTSLAWLIGFWRLAVLHKRTQQSIHNHISQEFANLTEKSSN